MSDFERNLIIAAVAVVILICVMIMFRRDLGDG